RTREDWLAEGLTFLVREGVEAVTIDAMCNLLGVTKGSFYHHFKSRHAYLEALLQYWEDEYTGKFIAFSLEGETPVEQIQRLNGLVVETHDTSEVAIRAWAQTDPMAHEFQERVDQRRLDFLVELQVKLHGDAVLARTMAQMVYAILIGSAQMMPPASKTELARLYDLIGQLTLRKIKEMEAE
ncbi:MAG: TetR/AcrR family transcriptional regulator, partial [Chloroflexota bacterium]